MGGDVVVGMTSPTMKRTNWHTDTSGEGMKLIQPIRR